MNSDSDGTMLMKAAITLLCLLGVGYAGWLGYSVTQIETQMSSLSTRVQDLWRFRHEINSGTDPQGGID